MTYQTQYRHKEAGAQGAAVPALQPEYGSARQRGQVTKVAIGAPILLPLPEREGCELSALSRQLSVLGDQRCPPERRRLGVEPPESKDPIPSDPVVIPSVAGIVVHSGLSSWSGLQCHCPINPMFIGG